MTIKRKKQLEIMDQIEKEIRRYRQLATDCTDAFLALPKRDRSAQGKLDRDARVQRLAGYSGIAEGLGIALILLQKGERNV